MILLYATSPNIGYVATLRSASMPSCGLCFCMSAAVIWNFEPQKKCRKFEMNIIVNMGR